MHVRKIIAALAVAATALGGVALAASPAAASGPGVSVGVPRTSATSRWYNNGGWEHMDNVQATRDDYAADGDVPTVQRTCLAMWDAAVKAQHYKRIPDATAQHDWARELAAQRAAGDYCVRGAFGGDRRAWANVTARIIAANWWAARLNKRMQRLGVFGVG